MKTTPAASRCRHCRAENDPGAARCWLCDAPDWEANPYEAPLGPLKADPPPTPGPATVVGRALVLFLLAVTTVVLVLVLSQRLFGLALVASGVWCGALGALVSRRRPSGPGDLLWSVFVTLGLLLALLGLVVLAVVIWLLVVCSKM